MVVVLNIQPLFTGILAQQAAQEAGLKPAKGFNPWVSSGRGGSSSNRGGRSLRLPGGTLKGRGRPPGRGMGRGRVGGGGRGRSMKAHALMPLEAPPQATVGPGGLLQVNIRPAPLGRLAAPHSAIAASLALEAGAANLGAEGREDALEVEEVDEVEGLEEMMGEDEEIDEMDEEGLEGVDDGLVEDDMEEEIIDGNIQV